MNARVRRRGKDKMRTLPERHEHGVVDASRVLM
jgi:hypothetical protein